MPGNLIWKKAFILGISLSVIFFAFHVFASSTVGVIDSTYKYAWGENIGWLNFGCDNCQVSVTDSGLTGNAWSRQYGWINLAPTNSGVKNDGTGILSGYAWGRNVGWIDFTGVTINSNGEFLGYATVRSDNSKINFNCADGNSCGSADFKVVTDWRPASVRPQQGGGGGGGRIFPWPPLLPPAVTTPAVSILENIFNPILNFFKPVQPAGNAVVEIPKIAPPAFSLRWNLLPVQAIHSFVFAPLPYEIRILASKFPELGNTFKNVGVERFTDINKLTDVTLNIPGLAEELNQTIKTVGVKNLADINKLNGVGLNIPGLSGINQLPNGLNIGTGRIALISGLPIASFPLVAKKNLPAEFVFARTSGELVDLNVALSLNSSTGQVMQEIETLPGKMMKLVVKPIGPAKSVTGYFIFEAATPRVSENQNSILRESLTASALFSMNDLVEKNPAPIPVENKLVLSSFEYTDPNHDGIYTADVVSPTTPGQYQIITVINYIDPSLGTRQMRLTAVIDPEGYVYEKNGDKETRIPSAIVSLYHLNLANKKYELWPAKDYQQENPQITDIRGTYSFLVPEGSYYFSVEAPGYNPYEGKVFVATQGGGIHQNIEMKSSQGWLSNFDWKTGLLVVVLLLLVYNLSKDKLSKIFKRT